MQRFLNVSKGVEQLGNGGNIEGHNIIGNGVIMG